MVQENEAKYPHRAVGPDHEFTLLPYVPLVKLVGSDRVR